MEIFTEIGPLKAFLSNKRVRGNSIGLVPTMGALHKGHLSLVEACQKENDLTVCSIYVNPTQFNNPEDLAKYPRTLEEDTRLLKNVGCDVLFCPLNGEMYGGDQLLKLNFGNLDSVMEGQFRPGHFSGVALVVAKLFNIVIPKTAYFGQKDWQQVAIIRQLTEELKFDLDLRIMPTMREPDGLAMSSRNRRLDDSERAQAIVFYQALEEARNALLAGIPLESAKDLVTRKVAQKPNTRLEYFELADSKNLNLLENVEQAAFPILCIAGYVGNVRLIDNMFLDLSSKRTK